MKELYEVRRQHRDTLDKAQALLEKVQADGREMTSAEETSYNGWLQMADRFQKKAEHLEALDNRMRTLPADEGQVISSFDAWFSSPNQRLLSGWTKREPCQGLFSIMQRWGTGALVFGKIMRGALTAIGRELKPSIGFCTTTRNLSSGGYAIPQYLPQGTYRPCPAKLY